VKILVLDGNENQAVAGVRSLARAGHQVIVGSTERWCKAAWSRYSMGSFRYPPPERDPLAFAGKVAEAAGAAPGTLVLPMTERSMLPISQHRRILEEAGAKIVLPSHPNVLHCFDKQYTTALAQALAMAVPHTVVIENAADARRLAPSLPYPVVLKPRSSQEPSASGRFRKTGGPMYARNAEEFVGAYSAISRRCSSVLAQEFVEGVGAGYFALMENGRLAAEFAHRRIRDVRPAGSGSSLRISVAVDDRIRSAALKLLYALSWHGVAMVEFRVRSDGTPVFMEVNGRFWHSLPLAVYAGVDFPALLAEMAEQGRAGAPTAYREGVRCRWLLGDLRHLAAVWAGPPAGFPGRFPGRIKTLLSFLLPVPGTYHDNFMLRDPLPEFADWLDFLMRVVPTALRKEQFAADHALSRTYSRS